LKTVSLVYSYPDKSLEVEREYEANKNPTLKPIYKFLKKFETFNNILFFFLFATFFFQKPAWCENRGATMSKDCNTDSEKNTYYVTQLL
jgi:hypothetical protein